MVARSKPSGLRAFVRDDRLPGFDRAALPAVLDVWNPLDVTNGREPEPAILRSNEAMKCASLLREAMWSMVQEIHSTLPIDYAAYTDENLDLLSKGLDNLLHHIGIARKYGIPVVVAINRFATDTPAELALIHKAAVEQGGAEDAVVANHWEMGGEGAVDLAKAVVKAAQKPRDFRFLYPLEASIKEKIETIAREVYGADGVDYSPAAEEQIENYTRLGFDRLAICMAKTHLSLSADANLKGVPKGFRLPVRESPASVGAGFLSPLIGKMSTMPGLPTRPAFFDIDIDPETERILGLS